MKNTVGYTDPLNREEHNERSEAENLTCTIAIASADVTSHNKVCFTLHTEDLYNEWWFDVVSATETIFTSILIIYWTK